MIYAPGRLYVSRKLSASPGGVGGARFDISTETANARTAVGENCIDGAEALRIYSGANRGSPVKWGRNKQLSRVF